MKWMADNVTSGAVMFQNDESDFSSDFDVSIVAMVMPVVAPSIENLAISICCLTNEKELSTSSADFKY